MQLKAERQGRISPLPTLLSRQSLLSESSTQSDSLSIPSTCDLSTQTKLSDSDESGNLVEPTSSSSELSISSSLPQTSSSSSSSSPSSSSSSSGEEGTVEVSRGSRSGPAEKGKLSVNSVHSCGLELEKREKEVPKRENSEEERSSMAYLSVSKFNDISNGAEEGQINQPLLIPPLTLRVQTEGKLRENKENFEKFTQTNDWLGHSMDDEVDGAIKNASCGSSAIQNYHPCYSSTGSAEPLFQGEGGLSDNLPRVTDQAERHGGATASTSWCNDVTDENRRNRERKVDSKSLKISQKSKNKSKEHLSVKSQNTTPGKFLGLKGGGQDPFFSNRSRGYENLESVINWNDKDAKPERVKPRDDMQNTVDKKESNFFGIRPCFLARHSDDSSITTPIDDMGNIAKNANGGSSNTFSRHQGSSCFTNEQGYQATYSFQAPSFHSESSKVSADAQGPNPHGSFGHNLAVWDLPVLVRPLLSLPCNGSEHLQTHSCDEPQIAVIHPHALINGDTPLAQTHPFPEQRKMKGQGTDPEVQRKRNYDFKVMNENPLRLSNTTSITQGLVFPGMEISAPPQAAMNRNLTRKTRTVEDQDTANQGPPSLSNDTSSADLERRVAETCSLVAKNLEKKRSKGKGNEEKRTKKKKKSGSGKDNKHVREKKGRQVKQGKRIAGITEKKSATRQAVEEKHLRKHQLVLRVDNGSVNIISGSAASSSYAVKSSFPVIVVITTLGVQMIISKQERHIMLSARFVAINKSYLDISFIQNFINAINEERVSVPLYFTIPTLDLYVELWRRLQESVA